MKIMVLAGGNDQAALIREIRHKFNNVEVLLIDMAKDVVAAKFADRHIVESTMDLPKVKEIAKNEGVDYIMTACGDQPLLTMAVVSEELGLPCYLSKKQVLDLTNKKFMKQKMKEAGIPTSRFCTSSSLDMLSDDGLSYPLIVKPVDSNGSKGVRKANTFEELKRFAEQAFKFSLSHTVVVEEFIEGTEFSLDYYVTDKGVTPVLKSQLNKYQVNDATSVIYQSIIPAPILNSLSTKMDDIATRIAQAFGLSNTPLLIQVIVRGEEIFVVEFSARLGGGAKYQTIQNVTGFNVLRANLESMFGEHPDIEINPSKKVYSRCHLYVNGGVFSSIDSIQQLLKDNTITEYVQTKPFGVQVNSPVSSSDRVASVFIEAKDYDMLQSKIRIAIDRIHVNDENKHDMLKRDMYI